MLFTDQTIFSTVKTYVEQVGRKRSVRHWNTLDSLDCLFNGPTATVEAWVPKIGQSHPEYPNMLADGIEIVRQAAQITELRVTYTGKFYGTGPVAIGSSTHWGESSWTTAAQVTTPATTYTYGFVSGIQTAFPTTVYVSAYVQYSHTCRYQIKTATYKTISRNPDMIIGKAGDSEVLSQSTWTSGASFLDSGNGLVHSVLNFETDMIDRQVGSLDNGWYEISESWGPQPVIRSSVSNFQPSLISSTTETISAPW